MYRSTAFDFSPTTAGWSSKDFKFKFFENRNLKKDSMKNFQNIKNVDELYEKFFHGLKNLINEARKNAYYAVIQFLF